MRTHTLAMLALFALAGACGGASEMVPLLASAGAPLTDPTTAPLRVVTRSTAVEDPLRVRGSGVAYADVEIAFGHAVASAMVPWSEAHQKNSGEGWELFVELTKSDAEYDGDRVIVSFAVRATLRARSGNDYLAQTQTSCRQGGIVAPDKGAPIIYGCMMEVGRNLAGWLDGVDLEAVGPPHHT